MSGIDHKAEAERLSNLSESAIDGMTVAEVHVSQAAAQVHATLYLAEQQKRTADAAHLANLIAFADSKWESGGESIVTNKETVMRVRMFAYEGLGLA